MENIKDFRYSHNIEEHIHIMSFARELKLRDISIGGLSFFNPNYEYRDVISVTITIPKILQIFNEQIEIVSIPNNEELFYRAKFINPSLEFILIFKEFMEENNREN